VSGKVLGFYEKDGYREGHFTGRKFEKFWQIKEEHIVPAVSVEWLEKHLCRGCKGFGGRGLKCQHKGCWNYINLVEAKKEAEKE